VVAVFHVRLLTIHMYECILVPTDGSDATRAPVEHAIDLATTYDAALHALNVVDTNLGF